MTAAVQKHLPIKIEFPRPVVDLPAAAAICELRVDEMRDKVDCAEIPAWDIAREFPNAERREIRIFAPAVRNLAQGKPCNDFDEDLIILRIYGRQRLLLKSTYLARCWHCDYRHVSHLIADKILESVQPLAQGIVADVTWASAVAFLKSRRIK